MGVVLVEGEDQLPELLRSTNVSTTRPGSPSSSGTTESAAVGLLLRGTHRVVIAASCTTLFVIVLLAFF